jgi:hypothetical protein
VEIIGIITLKSGGCKTRVARFFWYGIPNREKYDKMTAKYDKMTAQYDKMTTKYDKMTTK